MYFWNSLSSKYLVVNFVLVLVSVHATTKEEDPMIKKCEACRKIEERYRDGLKNTAKSNYGGGNTNWEENKLGSYALSETRMTEILEYLYKIEDKTAHSLLEQFEDRIENFWFKHFVKKTRVDFFQYFCITNAKVCCPKNTYGPTCQPCLGGKERPCKKRGKCIGEGTRGGTGKCNCTDGYMGELCDDCTVGFYLGFKNETHTVCHLCHKSCKTSCTDGTPFTCDACGQGWKYSDEYGCDDINECSLGNPCSGNFRCKNTVGWYECHRCDLSCDGCTGNGPEKCVRCANGYRPVDGKCVDIDECAENTDDCDTEVSSCENVEGKYVCKCHEGYVQDKNKDCIKKHKDISLKKKKSKKSEEESKQVANVTVSDAPLPKVEL